MVRSSAAAAPATAGGGSTAYRWNILLLLTCSQALAYLDRINLSVVGPELVRAQRYSPAVLGVLFSVFNWSFTLSLLAAGPFTDRVRARLAFPLGVALWSAATALCGLTTAFVPLVGLRALVGIGEAPMIPSGSRVIRETYEPNRRAVIVGTFFAGNKIGLTLGIPFVSVLSVLWGWPGVFYVTGALGILWVAWWLAVYRPPAPGDPAGAPDDAARTIRWATLLRYRTTWGLMFGQAGYLYIYYVFATWLPGYLVLQRHLSLLKTGFIGMLPFLVGTICVVLGGWAGDRIIAAGCSVTRARKGFAVGGLFAATIFTVAGAYTPQTAPAIALLTLAVAGFSFATAAVNSMPIDVAPSHIVSSLVSLQNFGGNLGGSFAPVVTGLLISQGGSFALPLLIAGAIALVFGCGAFGLLVGDLDHTLAAPAAARPALRR